ncbi:LytR family transcriptional regulator [Nocardia sp. ET3-3]|uniref:LytR family transcriptional regulator n=1 Tax=Nocardia terrae TaxID=2675851 RepID=A0A7K1UQN4_9NOCA|nr:LCP family protein [Nocardia terrae]MVU76660.1 LytR family transcriptional regulator [Nocardia terrae]
MSYTRASRRAIEDPVTTPLRPYQGGPNPGGPRGARRRRKATPPRARRALLAGRGAGLVLAAAVFVTTGFTWREYDHVMKNVNTSHIDVLDKPDPGKHSDQNILIMGLDSRLDERGYPLPQDMYDAIHAGDDSVGGYNSNVLILLHIPGDGSKATGISIPRDDYVTLDPAACLYSSPCKGKIKQAYGFAYEKEKEKLQAAAGKTTSKSASTSTTAEPVDEELEQKARNAGRVAEINTVKTFLGNNVKVNNSVEVTLAAFFQIAQAVQPITVCLNEKTSDNFSGADFVKGSQDIDASQAMAFVRQRRDPDETLNFTDLDRTRRQQAFIVSLAHKLNNNGTLANTGTLQKLLDVAKQNMWFDDSLDLIDFMHRATGLMGGGMSLFTLPVKDFGQNEEGEDINIVDLDEIHGIVKGLLPQPNSSNAATSATPASTTIPGATSMTIDVTNSSGVSGLAGKLETALAAKGFTPGTATTGADRTSSTLSYAPGADMAANALASQLGLTATKSSSLASNTIELVVGSDSAATGPIADLAATVSDTATTTKTTATTPPPAPVAATQTGDNAPAPTDLSTMDSSGVPCVK